MKNIFRLTTKGPTAKNMKEPISESKNRSVSQESLRKMNEEKKLEPLES